MKERGGNKINREKRVKKENQKEKEEGREGGIQILWRSPLSLISLSYFLNAFLHITCNNRIYNYLSILSQLHFKQISLQMSKTERCEFATSFG